MNNRFPPPRGLALLLSVVLVSYGCGSGDQSQDFSFDRLDQALAPTGPIGQIRGVVRLQGDPPPAAYDQIRQDQQVCGDNVYLPRLKVGADNGVGNAFVFLENAPSTGAIRPQQSLVLDQKDCQFAPQALTVPAGGNVEITNSDPILHNVHAREMTDQGLRTVFNIAQPVQGARTAVDLSRTKPGIMALSCEAGHPWMSGYIFVADHPYIAVTARTGEFVISDVPAGTYRIKMWHEGVRLVRHIEHLQVYEYEQPYEVVHEVVVEADSETVIDFDLMLRPEPAA